MTNHARLFKSNFYQHHATYHTFSRIEIPLELYFTHMTLLSRAFLDEGAHNFNHIVSEKPRSILQFPLFRWMWPAVKTRYSLYFPMRYMNTFTQWHFSLWKPFEINGRQIITRWKTLTEIAYDMRIYNKSFRRSTKILVCAFFFEKNKHWMLFQ